MSRVRLAFLRKSGSRGGSAAVVIFEFQVLVQSPVFFVKGMPQFLLVYRTKVNRNVDGKNGICKGYCPRALKKGRFKLSWHELSCSFQ